MSGGVSGSVGHVLRAAREAQGLTVEGAALRLRLMHRQIEAMETDAFDSLGQPVFARGFVRNYARLLGLSPEPLLAEMQGAPEISEPVTPIEPLPRTSWLLSPWMILLLLGIVLVLALPVGMYLWLNSEAEEPVRQVAPVKPAQSVPAAVAPSPVPELKAVPAVVPEIASDATPAEDSPPAPVPAAGTGTLRFESAEDAWVEVKDASGRVLLHQLNPAGSEMDIAGQPPFELVVGNAGQVRMTYNGRVVDLKPFTEVTVARFTLEE